MKILRHNAIVRISHWLVAVATFILFFSGFGQMPIYKRYMVDQLPGLAWSSDYIVTLQIHYLAAALLVFGSIYYLTYFIISKNWDILPRRGDIKESVIILASLIGLAKEPENDKYLAEQRLAFAVTALSLAALIISGSIKVYKNLPGVDISATAIFWSAQIHNLFTIILFLAVVVHLLAFINKDNRQLLPSMFTGKIAYDYAARRHSKWVNRLNQSSDGPAPGKRLY